MIGHKIRKYRKLRGLTQDGLARKADIPYTTLNKIEIGDIKHPRIDTIGKIAGALKVKIDKLVNG
ncbi:MAG: helix-turn-helix domain-containing protein [Elusimicrobia bacterium]|nr:helix-turn-helix domain-containing protein [Elusimicrobiota bacterium]MBU2615040.1 helix-turn-helix domain-containing protein [Elusimicrobiota bacterium]